MPTFESDGSGLRTAFNVPIPMRDGIVLKANIFLPEREGPVPAILERTPYGKRGHDTAVRRYVLAGYACIFMDTRGRYASGGDWIPFITPETYEGTDGYDTIEWIASQPWCNGRVGTTGASYNALVQWRTAPLRPPHLCAMSARTIPTEFNELDWTGGIFRLARRLRWLFVTMAHDVRRRAGWQHLHKADSVLAAWNLEGESLMRTLPVSAIADQLPSPMDHYFRDWLKNPSVRLWHFNEGHHEVDVPNLDVTGWFDHCNDSLRHLAGMQAHGRTETARRQSRVILGPWSHITPGQPSCGAFDFGPAAQQDIDGLILRWFDHWLKDEPNGVTEDPTVRYFMLGSNTWKTAPAWPPPNTRDQAWYLAGTGYAAVPGKPGDLCTTAAEGSPDSFDYDPMNPVPSLLNANLFTEANNRARLDHRDDIARYRSAPLSEAVEIAGNARVILHAASSARDTDFHIHLADEAPDGTAMELASGAIRARYRNGTDREALLTPGVPVELTIELGPTACRFAPSHRIRLEITSSNFPNFDRNHNTGGDDLHETTLVTARQTVFHNPQHPSRLILPIST